VQSCWVVIISLQEKLILARSCLNNATKPITCTIFIGGGKKRDFVWISESFLCKLRFKAFSYFVWSRRPIIITHNGRKYGITKHVFLEFYQVSVGEID